jgi:L-seryl-tRNA(Ser) seleniumtransferase
MSQSEEYKKIPAVDQLLLQAKVQAWVDSYNRPLVVFCIQKVIEDIRSEIKEGKACPDIDFILLKVEKEIKAIADANMKKILNGTGVLIHTNLGRSPFGKDLIEDAFKSIDKYNNLEFDLEKGSRGHRDSHITNILRYLTGAEDVVVVNNNAAAVMLILRTLAKHKEVIVSRGELIEIGGAFRVPDILKASDCNMIEVGTTNKTKLADYEDAITENTAILLKTHKSNYTITGLTKEVALEELSALGKKLNIPVVFDIGSGLLKKVNHPALTDEPDVKTALSTGVDLLCFSGDKLLGGPQAGVIVGKKEWIAKIKKEPMMRALRVGKTTLSILETAARYYLNEEVLFEKNVFYKTLLQTDEALKSKALHLKELFQKNGIESEIEKSQGQCGGGTLPDKFLDSYAVKLVFEKKNQERSKLAKKIYHQLLDQDVAVLSVLKGANIYFDILTLDIPEIEILCEKVNDCFNFLQLK